MYIGFCTQCGAPFQGDERFCTQCGAPREAEAMATCSNCGQVIEGTGSFCVNCGAPLHQGDSVRFGEAVRVQEKSSQPAFDAVAIGQEPAYAEKAQAAGRSSMGQCQTSQFSASQAPVDPLPTKSVASSTCDFEAVSSIDYVSEDAITICPGCSAVLDASVTQCTQCGRVLVETPAPTVSAPSLSVASNQVARQEQAEVRASTTKRERTQGVSSSRTLREEAEEEDCYQTLVLSEDYRSEDFSETTILVEQNLVSLFRRSTGEMFVAEPPLVLGRGSEATCCVSGNSAISRKHAEIVSRDGKYYLRDLGSANKTKVGGTALSPHSLVEIKDETEFSLGDEEFVFHVGEKWCLAATQVVGRV